MARWQKLGWLAPTLLISSPTLAQDHDDEQQAADLARISELIETWDSAYYDRNPAALTEASAESRPVISLRVLPGEDRLTIRPVRRVMQQLAEEDSELAGESWNQRVLIDGYVAVAMNSFIFYNGGERTHCGVQVYNFLKVDGEWTITGVQYTIEADGCPSDR